jgi:hypothetical protein
MTATLSKATVESKAVLARMLATENLSVEHNPKAETAYFDVENRKLVFPCWEGMTDHLYDMLGGSRNRPRPVHARRYGEPSTRRSRQLIPDPKPRVLPRVT